MTRKQAYKWLADVTGLDRDDAHISMFDLKQCLEVEHHCRARFIGRINAAIGKGYKI